MNPALQPPADGRAPLPTDEGLAYLAEVLAHRIRGLVTGIEGFTDLLIDTLGTREQRELALRIFESASRIEHVLADLQRYSRPVQPARTHLTVHEVVDSLLAALGDTDLERIRLDVHADAFPAVEADPVLLRQALLVLLQNALDATRQGGVVQFSVLRDDEAGSIQFVVQNDGVIAVEEAELRVFTPFYTTKAHNLGVGLSIARRIAEAHNGTLRLTANDAHQGVSFSLHLPVDLEP